jgi:hypothetical protein
VSFTTLCFTSNALKICGHAVLRLARAVSLAQNDAAPAAPRRAAPRRNGCTGVGERGLLEAGFTGRRPPPA